MALLYVFIGLVLLVVGGDFLVKSSVGLSLKMNISRMVVGLTVVSFATSAPELIVSVNAAMKGLSDIALGNVVGSNIANIGLVLGLTAMISPLVIDRDFLRFNWPVMIGFSGLLYYLLWNNQKITQMEGFLLVGFLIVFLFTLIRRARKAKNTVSSEITPEAAQSGWFKIGIWLVIGGLGLWGGSELLVTGAVEIAQALEVSERVISVTMIAIGTSIPELAASVIAALKKEEAISIGNLIGSNIFNIASVLGFTAIIQPINMDSPAILSNDILWMIGFAAILLPLALVPKRNQYGRWKGLLLVTGYCIFITLAFIS